VDAFEVRGRLYFEYCLKHGFSSLAYPSFSILLNGAFDLFFSGQVTHSSRETHSPQTHLVKAQAQSYSYLACVLTALAAKDAEGSGWVHDGRIMEPPEAIHAFRRSLYECFNRRGDALFELTDAMPTADGAAPSPVHLSLQASHRRGWGSLYAALDRGRIDDEALRKLLARHPLAGAQGEMPVYAVDASVWDRCDAETSP
jgi:hypothetical protein